MDNHRKYKRKEGNIDANTLQKLSQLFDKKQWNKMVNSQNGIFNRYIRTLSMMDKACQKLMLDLTSRFIYIHGTEYEICLAELINNISSKYPSYDLLIARDFQCYYTKKVKSSSFVFYTIEGPDVKMRLNKVPTFLEDIDKTEKRGIEQNTILVIVDDFVGTGKTMSSAVNDYMVYLSIPKDRIVVLTIAIMASGLTRLNNKGIKVEYHTILNRGISDYYKGKDLKRNRELMTKIEDGLSNLNPDYRFGYLQSESLICMERCPNNTFPVYWLGKNSPYERSIKKT